jgi:uncharacterized protein YndB with AHSA1/START domain
MSTNHIDVSTSIDTVWSVLADPRMYNRFVVGNKRIRRFDPVWPELDAEIHHTVGVGPAMLRDSSRVIEVRPPALLRLSAGLRPIGVSEITFSLEATGPETTRVTIEEQFCEGPATRVWTPVLETMLAARNMELLRRLRRIAEHRGETTALESGTGLVGPA